MLQDVETLGGYTPTRVLSCVQLFATPWTVAHQAPLPMEFSRQEYWSGLPFPSPLHSHSRSLALKIDCEWIPTKD